MGGQGSGRPPSAESIIKKTQFQPQAPIASSGGEGMFLPNLSGVQHELRRGTHNITTDDLAEGVTNLYDTHPSGYIPNEHIDWTNATQNLLTTGSGVFNNIQLSGQSIFSKTGSLTL